MGLTLRYVPSCPGDWVLDLLVPFHGMTLRAEGHLASLGSESAIVRVPGDIPESVVIDLWTGARLRGSKWLEGAGISPEDATALRQMARLQQ